MSDLTKPLVLRFEASIFVLENSALMAENASMESLKEPITACVRTIRKIKLETTLLCKNKKIDSEQAQYSLMEMLAFLQSHLMLELFAELKATLVAYLKASRVSGEILNKLNSFCTAVDDVRDEIELLNPLIHA